MKMQRIKSIVVVVILVLLHSPPLQSAELRPFILPSTQPDGGERSPGRSSSVPDEPAVYSKFADYAGKLSPEERQSLAARYRQLQSEAVTRGNQVESYYYGRLLDILNQQ